MRETTRRTRLREHLGPVEAGLLVGARSSVHGHAVLVGHVEVGQLRVNVGSVAVVATGHVPAIPVGLIVAHTARSRKLVLVVGHVSHIVRNLDHTEWMDNAVSGHVIHATIHVIHVAFIGLLRILLLLLNVGLRVRQMAHSGRVSSANRALLEVSLEDITTGKRIATQHAHVRAVASVCTTGLAFLVDRKKGHLVVATYVGGDGVSNASREDMSLCSAGKEICHRRPSGE